MVKGSKVTKATKEIKATKKKVQKATKKKVHDKEEREHQKDDARNVQEGGKLKRVRRSIRRGTDRRGQNKTSMGMTTTKRENRKEEKINANREKRCQNRNNENIIFKVENFIKLFFSLLVQGSVRKKILDKNSTFHF